MRLCGRSAPGANSVCYNATPAQSFAQVAGPNEQTIGTHKWNTGIVARVRIYFAASNKVYGLPFREETPHPNRKGNTTNARIETTDGI
jgi:hypothetical protein